MAQIEAEKSNHAPWIVMAAYNEGSRLATTLAKVTSEYSNVIVVDDGSSDDTWQIAGEFNVWRLRHIVNCGQGAALQTGLEFALEQGADIIVTFDSDGQHMVSEIESICEPIRAGRVDVALGSRFLGETEGLPASRWGILKLGIIFTRVFSRIHVTDTHNGFRAFSAKAARAMNIRQNRMAHASEILDQIVRFKLSFEEVPVTIRYNEDTLEKGQSSLNGLRIVGQLLLGRLIR